jgi:hypothetical protein
MINIQRGYYIITNNSFKKKELIYPLTSRGFFSEINNLALAILYCLEEKINFKIFTKKWVSGEWQDYFESIFDEYNGIVPIPNDIFVVRRKDMFYNFYHKHLRGRELVQTDIWHKMHNVDFTNRSFYYPLLGINGTIYDAKKQIFKLILQFNNETKTIVNLNNQIDHQFIKESFGIHIRRGDKIFGNLQEAGNINLQSYINKAISIDPTIFKFTICTDDFTVIETLRNAYPSFQFYTLCNPVKRGYDQNNFNKLTDKKDKKEEVYSILTDSNILIESKIFIGTYSSNISRYVGIMRDSLLCYSIDKDLSPN